MAGWWVNGGGDVGARRITIASRGPVDRADGAASPARRRHRRRRFGNKSAEEIYILLAQTCPTHFHERPTPMTGRGGTAPLA